MMDGVYNRSRNRGGSQGQFGWWEKSAVFGGGLEVTGECRSLG